MYIKYLEYSILINNVWAMAGTNKQWMGWIILFTNKSNMDRQLKSFTRMCANCKCYHCDSFQPVVDSSKVNLPYTPFKLVDYPHTQTYSAAIQFGMSEDKKIQKIPSFSFDELKRPLSNYLEETNAISRRYQTPQSIIRDDYSKPPPLPRPLSNSKRSKSATKEVVSQKPIEWRGFDTLKPQPSSNYRGVLSGDSSSKQQLNHERYQPKIKSTYSLVPDSETVIQQPSRHEEIKPMNLAPAFEGTSTRLSNNVSVKESGKAGEKDSKKLNLSTQRQRHIEHCAQRDYRCLGVDLREDKSQEIIIDASGHHSRCLQR